MKLDTGALLTLGHKLLRAVQAGLVLVLIGLALSGLRSVGSDETALVLRFGKLIRTAGPGLLFTWPSPVDRVITLPTGRVQQITVTDFGGEAPLSGDLRSSGYGLTGDQGAVICEATAKYVISDPAAFALQYSDGEAALKGIVAASLARVMASSPLDGLLTAQKEALAGEVTARAQTVANKLALGVRLLGLEFRTLQPPAEVKSAFDDVTDAAVKADTQRQLARHYAEELIPEAHADAERMVSDARVTAELNLSKARTDTAELVSLVGSTYGQAVSRWSAKIDALLARAGHLYLVPAGHTPWLKLP